MAGPQNHAFNFNFTSPLLHTFQGGFVLACAEAGVLMACAAYDLAGIYMAQGRVYGVQHVRGHDPGPGDHGTLSAREPVPARQAVGLEASSVIPSGRSHLAGHGLAPVKAGKFLAVGTQLFSKIEGQSQHRSRNNLQLLRCLHCANRRSIEWRQAPRVK